MDASKIAAQNEIIKEVVDELLKFQLKISEQIVDFAKLEETLSSILNNLITNDFSRFIAILYRLDISERKLKELLKSSPDTSAGDIIAKMIIERQIEKITSRKSIQSQNSKCDEEKW